MKKLLNLAVNKMNSVKQDLNRGLDMSKARREVSMFLFAPRLGYWNNLPIYRSNDLVLAVTGSYATEPCALVSKEGEIYVNEAFTNLPEEFKEAILSHEEGHVKMKHSSGLLYPLQARFGFGIGIEYEFQADAYAYEQGKDMLGALEHLYTFPAFRNRALKLRIARLKEKV